jgi:hypothetical protein
VRRDGGRMDGVEIMAQSTNAFIIRSTVASTKVLFRMNARLGIVLAVSK